MLPGISKNGGTGAKKPKVRPGLTVREMLNACMRGGLPQDVYQEAQKSEINKSLLSVLAFLGDLEPRSAHRPSFLEPVNVTRKYITVEPAPPRSPDDARAIEPDPSGNQVPNGPFSETLALQFCGPMDGVLIVKKVRVVPANITAQQFGTIEYKHRAFAGGFDLCTQFQHKTKPGTLITLENVVLCSEQGFELYLRNHHLSSEAAFEVRTIEWMTQ